jgi:hypothetical protein
MRTVFSRIASYDAPLGKRAEAEPGREPMPGDNRPWHRKSVCEREGDFSPGIRQAASHGSSALNFRIADHSLGAAPFT